MGGSVGSWGRYGEVMGMDRTPATPAPDPYLDVWCKVALTLWVVLIFGAQLVAEQPGLVLFLVSAAFFVIPAAFLGALLTWVGLEVKSFFTGDPLPY